MCSKNIISQFTGSFLNQTIIIPSYGHNSFYEYPIVPSITYDSQIDERLFIIWMVMFWISFFSIGHLVYRLLQSIWYHISTKTTSDVVDDMRSMMNEISDLSLAEKQMKSEKYYILTNLLVNRFRIEVYEKILK